MAKTTARLFALGSLLTLVVFAPSVFAQTTSAQPDPRAAKVHVDAGARAYDLGRFTDAITEFQKAYEIDPAPILLFNIAQAYRQNGDHQKALFFYRRYLDRAPDAPNRAGVEKRMRELEDLLSRQTELKQKPPTEVETAVGGSQGSATHPPTNPVQPTVPPEGRPQPTTPPPPSAGAGWRRTAGWISAGTAALALGTGVAFHIVSSGKLSSFDEACGLDANDSPVSDPSRGVMRTTAECADLRDGWSTNRRLAAVGYVGAAVFAATSAVLFLTSRSETSNGGPALACAPALGSLHCRLTF